MILRENGFHWIRLRTFHNPRGTGLFFPDGRTKSAIALYRKMATDYR